MFFFFFFNDTATTEIYTLSLHDALPISRWGAAAAARSQPLRQLREWRAGRGARARARRGRGARRRPGRQAGADRRRRSATRVARLKLPQKSSPVARRRSFEVFTLSFLDTICCGFGAVILFYTILSAQAGAVRLRETDVLSAEVDRLMEQVQTGERNLAVLRA